MQEKHWTEDQVIAELYGVGPEDGHLDRCPRCRTQLDRLICRREERLQQDIPVSHILLAAQRRAVLARIDRLPQWWSRFHLIPLAAIALLCLVGVLIVPSRRNNPPPGPLPVAVSDVELFEDVFAKAYSMEPTASQPLQALFEVKQ